MERPQLIVFFDGVCGLCNAFVDFAMTHDRRGRLLFSALQGKKALEVLPQNIREDLETVVVYNGRDIQLRSRAVLTVLREFGGGWAWVSRGLALVPTPILDLGYKLVARVRYRVFGERESCRLPTPEERRRFLD